MKLALIPPVSWLETASSTGYQLVLPMLMAENPEYARFYRGLRLNRLQYMILDNGAAEEEQVPDQELAAIALKEKVNEVAMPDVLADMYATVERSKRFARQYGVPLAAKGIKLGYVAQGRSITECIEGILASQKFSVRPMTIYLPRLLLAATGIPNIRIDLAQWIAASYPELDIHFFGMDAYYMSELKRANHVLGDYLRGVDTSAPFNFAFHDYPIDGDREARRPDDYFDLPKEAFKQPTLDYNIRKLQAWTR